MGHSVYSFNVKGQQATTLLQRKSRMPVGRVWTMGTHTVTDEASCMVLTASIRDNWQINN